MLLPVCKVMSMPGPEGGSPNQKMPEELPVKKKKRGSVSNGTVLLEKIISVQVHEAESTESAPSTSSLPDLGGGGR